MTRRVIGPGQTGDKGQFYWYRITSFSAGATYAIDGQNPIVADSLAGYEIEIGGKPWQRVDITGTITVELGDDPREKYPGPVNPQGALAPAFSPTTGNLVNASDVVVMPASGLQWAFVKMTVLQGGGGGSNPVSIQISNDGGINWFLAPASRRINLVSANPNVLVLNGTIVTQGDIWETPLPSNTTHIRAFTSGAGTPVQVRFDGQQLYIPGCVVLGVLYDQTETGIGTGLDTGSLDVSGWREVSIFLQTPTTQTFLIRAVDDTGAALPQNLASTAASNETIYLPLASAGAPAAIPAGAYNAYPLWDRRIRVNLPVGGTVTQGRSRIVARR